MKLRWWLSFLLAASFLLVSARHAHGQWTWLYPTPHGNTLYDVTFLDDNTAIAVGDAGTIMVSHDAGATWGTTFRTNGVATALRRIDLIDDATAVVVGNAGVILKTSNGGTSWATMPGGLNADLIDVSFSGSVGIAAAYGPYPLPNRMLRSTNAGDTWTSVPGAPLPVYGVCMATPLVSYCLAGYTLFKSTDGGLTWAYIPTAPSLPVYSHAPLAFADAMNGVVPGLGSSINVTHNGGVTWTQQFIGTVYTEGGKSASDLEFRSPSTIVASVIEGMCDVYTGADCSTWGDMFRSLNDGVTWIDNGSPRDLQGIASNSAGIVVAVGKDGVTYRWTPPDTWQQIGGTTAQDDLPDLAHLAFATPTTGTVLGSNTFYAYAGSSSAANVLMRTATGGSSWDLSSWGDRRSNLKDIAYALGSSDLYALASPSNGVTTTSALLKSTDGGANWSPAWSNTQDFKLIALKFSSATHGVAVGYGGYAAVIDGSTVTTLGIASGIWNLSFADGSTVIAVGNGATRIIRSTDGGTTWAPVTSPLNKALNDVGFSSPSVGVIVGKDGSILRTTDAGASWSPVSGPTTASLNAVAFSGAYGLAVGQYNSAVIETEDAGLTWTNVAGPPAGMLSDVVVFGAHHAIVAGPYLNVLEYRENTVPTLFSSFDVTPREFAAELRWAVQVDADLQSFRLARNGVELTALQRDARAYRDESVRPGASYEYTLIAVDRNGDQTRSAPVRVTIPKAALELLPNQPNPFNPETMIRFIVPEKMRVTLSVHDVAGRVVATLVDDVRDPGLQTITWNAEGMASGVYFARLRAGKTEVSRKMVLLK